MESGSENKVTIEDLPEEVMLNIFKHLYDLRKTAEVCTT